MLFHHIIQFLLKLVVDNIHHLLGIHIQLIYHISRDIDCDILYIIDDSTLFAFDYNWLRLGLWIICYNANILMTKYMKPIYIKSWFTSRLI